MIVNWTFETHIHIINQLTIQLTIYYLIDKFDHFYPAHKFNSLEVQIHIFCDMGKIFIQYLFKLSSAIH